MFSIFSISLGRCSLGYGLLSNCYGLSIKYILLSYRLMFSIKFYKYLLSLVYSNIINKYLLLMDYVLFFVFGYSLLFGYWLY